MDNLPSLSLGSTPWSATHRYSRVGGGGRLYSHEDSLLSSLDETPLMSPSDENNKRRRWRSSQLGEDEDEGEEEEVEENVQAKWRNRLKSREGLTKWLFGGGVQLAAEE